MKLKNLELRNVYGFRRLSTKFPRKPGMVLVTGERDGSAVNSIGVGKSSLFEGIRFILFGDNAKGSSVIDVVRLGSKSCQGGVELGKHTILRSRGSKASFTLDEKDVKYIEGKSLIYDTFLLTEKVWENCIHYNQLDVSRFMLSTPKEKKLFLSALFALFIYQKCYAEAGVMKRECERNIDRMEGTIESLRDVIKKLKKIKKKNVRKERDKCAKWKGKAIITNKKCKIARKRYEFAAKWRNVVERKRDECEHIIEVQTEIMNEKNCKRCGKPISREIRLKAEKLVEKWKPKQKKFRLVLFLAKVAVNKATKLNDKTQSILDHQMRHYHYLRQKILDSKKDTRDIDKLKNRLKDCKETLRTLKIKHKTSEGVCKVFHQDGFPSYYATLMCELLNTYLSQIVGLLGGRIKPTISSKKLDIVVEREDGRIASVKSCSGGEQRLISVLLFLAFNKVYRYICEEAGMEIAEFIVLDEPLAQLDRSVIKRFTGFIGEYAEFERLTVFLITNDLWLSKNNFWKNRMVVKKVGQKTNIKLLMG